MKKYSTCYAGLMVLALALSACSKDSKQEGGDGGNAQGKYVIAVSPVASTGVADYLLTAADLDAGTITTAGNGIEQDGTYRYYVTHNNKFFSMLYGQGNPGAVTAYELNKEGKLAKLTNFQTETVQAFAPVDKDILMFKIPRSGGANALWYRVNSDQLLITAEGQSNVVELAGNGERAHFTWIKQVGNKVFAPYMSIKGCCSDNFGTAYPDSAWIAVYNYPSMTLEKVIRDNRTSFIGRYFVDGLAVVENDDVYGFSSSVATNSGAYTSTKPSAVVRIKSGTTEFDKSYFFDLKAASNGFYMTNQVYVGNGNFILLMEKDKGAYATGRYFAAVNVNTKTFNWITNTPDPATISSVTSNNFSPRDGKTAYIGITFTNGGSFVYKFDAVANTVSQGLKVEGGKITAISRLSSK
ncbi:DUF4374 domain-containing protein [Paraflavitalea speifideaquila]|uniref:DUF4374 domain-containing protein n=1 Tax=Paraflavitalea speifideaquila TaxID=3076558 RepID=UPI0028F13A5E|nr:DUF4374 domain-containing protein [Paraflavitalea speifideiaquila]